MWISQQPASAQVAWDPAAVVHAYVAALNAQDVPAAVALFDEFGSATDSYHHNFSGADGLARFLRANGFASPDAQITTEQLTIVSNRAIWVYSCTCAAGSTRVHLVTTTDGKISVFAMVPPPPPAAPVSSANGLVSWLIGGAVLLAGGIGWMFGRRRKEPAPQKAWPTQGHLLRALRQMHELKG